MYKGSVIFSPRCLNSSMRTQRRYSADDVKSISLLIVGFSPESLGTQSGESVGPLDKVFLPFATVYGEYQFIL